MVNHLLRSISKIWEGATEWPIRLHLKIHHYHSGEFIGNDCLKLLSNVDLLQELVTTKKLTPAVGFARTFKYFNDVVQSSFGNTLHSDFEHHIKEFQKSCLSLPISVTPKAHAVFHHNIHQITKSWT